MIAPHHPEYLEAKAIKKGIKKISQDWLPLAQWIYEKYGTAPLNIAYNSDKESQKLLIIVEDEKDAARFYTTNHTTDLNISKSILKKYRELYPNSSTQLSSIVCATFKPAAIAEANDSIEVVKLETLKSHFAEQVWEISRFMGYTTIFFYTQKQLQESMSNGLQSQLVNAYFALLKPFDEFDYIHKDSLKVYFDSKENFDKTYEGKWYFYYR